MGCQYDKNKKAALCYIVRNGPLFLD